MSATWFELAACRGMTRLFYDERREADAAAICDGCSVRAPCLEVALTTRESEGTARNQTQVLDVAQLLLASVKRGSTPSNGSE